VKSPSGWTLETYVAHNEAMREADARLQQERDRRYSEVKSAEEKALHVKEQADRDALGLAREIQAYKDERANNLREQIAAERGEYATKADIKSLSDKFDAANKPVVEFMSSMSGRGAGFADGRAILAWVVALIAGLIAVGSFFFRVKP